MVLALDIALSVAMFSPFVGVDRINILSEIGIGLSCLAVAVVMIRWVRIQAVANTGSVRLLPVFIAVCAAAHVLNAAVLTWPGFAVLNLLKLVVVMAAVVVAFALMGLLPRGLVRPDAVLHESEIGEGRIDLESSRQQAMAIVAASPVGQIVVDFSGVIVTANPMAEMIFGYSPSELVGEPIEILVPKTQRANHRRLREDFIRKPLARRAIEGRNLNGLHRSGAEIPVQIGLVLLDVGDGQTVLCSIVDLSERRRAEEVQRRFHLEVRDLASKLKGVIDNSKNFIGILDTNGIVVDVNATSFAIAGDADVIGQPFDQTPWWSHCKQLQDRVREAIATAASGKRDSFEATHVAPDGAVIDVDVSFTPLVNEDGDVTFLIPEGRDITEHKRREEELGRLNDELTRSNRELEQFAYVASHDLQEPLRKITSYAELLKENVEIELDQQATRDLGVVMSGAERMKVLVTDLLEFSRITTHGNPLGSVDTNNCLAAAIGNLELMIQENGAELTFDSLPNVVADSGQLIQLFQNLLSNAIKYRGEADPVIHVGGRIVGSMLECYVQDNGIGIEPKYADSVFDIFRRLHGRSEYSGTGIGLAICRRLVERFGGRIWVVSTGEDGCRFYFTANIAGD